MAITYQAQPSDQVVIDPDDSRGPWTIELPNPQETAANNGWWVDVKAEDFGRTTVTITATGTAQIREANFSATPVTSVDRVFTADSIRFTWDAEKNLWRIFVTAAPNRHTAVLAGDCDNITGNNQTITGWAAGAATQFFQIVPAPSQGDGTITIPKTGIYWLAVWVLGTQSNSNKEFQIVLRLDRSVSGNIDIATFQVATDKTPRYRHFSFPRALIAGVADEEWSLSMRAEGDSFGNINSITGSFAVEQGFLT